MITAVRLQQILKVSAALCAGALLAACDEEAEAPPAPLPAPPREATLQEDVDRVLGVLARGLRADATPALGRILAACAEAKAAGKAPYTFLTETVAANPYLQSGVSPGALDEDLKQCLLKNWSLAEQYGLLTPENLRRFRQGEPPLATRGLCSGERVEAVFRGTGWNVGAVLPELNLMAVSRKRVWLASGVPITPEPAPTGGVVAPRRNPGWGTPVPAASGSWRSRDPRLATFAPRPAARPTPEPQRTPSLPTPRTFVGNSEPKPTPRWLEPAVVRMADVGLGEQIALQNYGERPGRHHLVVRSVDRGSGVRLSLIDDWRKATKQLYTRDGYGNNSRSGTAEVSTISTQSVPLNPVKIPDSTFTGTRIFHGSSFDVYVSEGSTGLNRCRLIFCDTTGRVRVP